MHVPASTALLRVPNCYVFFPSTHPESGPPRSLQLCRTSCPSPPSFAHPVAARMTARQESDNLAWDRSDELWDEATKQVRLSSTCRNVEAFAERVLGKPATLVPPLIISGFNVLYPIRGVKSHSNNLLVRLPYPNQTIAPTEKTLTEAATSAFIHQHTQVPVPKALHYGDDPEIGPFMIIPDLGTRRGMSDALEAPRDDPNDTPVLNPNISEDKLRSLYGKLARCVLQLVQPTFPRIGALVETYPGSFGVLGRPITLNMNNMVQLSNIPKSIFSPKGTTYQTADEWYVELATMQMATLLFQHNDMVSSEDDCRNKYVARQLFLRFAKQGRLSKFGFSDDDWPVNILVDQDDDILGVIDWELAYAAPTQFILDPPWWLLLDVPEMWDDGIDDWASVYHKRLDTWLSAMEQAEEDTSPISLPLSAYMRESWATGRFWLNYAARKSWTFDTIFWQYLDERFFGEREKDIPKESLWKTRLDLLSEEERAAMEPLVQIKMEESQTRVLVDWDAEEARKHLSSFLFD